MRVTLRKWEEEDILDLVKAANNYKVAKYLRDCFPYPYRLEHGEYFLSMCKKADPKKECLLAIDVDGVAVGNIGLTFGEDVQRNTAEIGYWLGEEYWNKGIATKAVALMLEIAFKEYKLHRVYATFIETNMASGRVLEKNGFLYEGRLCRSITKEGEVYDSLLYAITDQA